MLIEDAKKKWCPMIRFQIGPQNPHWQNKAFSNRAQEFEPDACLCVATDCAVWVPSALFPNENGYCGLTHP